MDKAELERLFTYHPPESFVEVTQYDIIRETGKYFARVVVANTPPGPDQTAAIRKIREAVMTANAAIATRQRCELKGDIGKTEAVDPNRDYCKKQAPFLD